MVYQIAVTLQVFHEYWGDEIVPVDIVPRSPNDFTKAGFLAKQSPARLDVIADTDIHSSPSQMTLDIVAQDDDIFTVTDGPDWNTLHHLDLTGISQDTTIRLQDVLKRTDTPRVPGDPLLRVDVDIPSAGTCVIALNLSTVSSLWAYYVTGNKVDVPLQIIDKNNEISFDDLGKTHLPDGSAARVLRSKAPIALHYRPESRFALEAPQDSPFDPITLIPVLPAAGVNLRPTTDLAAAAPLQSDIFISLW